MTDTTEIDGLELANCPFCGGEGVILEDSGYNGKGFVRCWTCHSAGPESDSKKEAVAAWNSRPIDTPRESAPPSQSDEQAYREYADRPVEGHADGFKPGTPALQHAFFAGVAHGRSAKP